MRRWFCFLGKDKMAVDRNIVRLAVMPALGAMLLLAAAASIGCDSNSFVPPRPEELGGTGTATSVPVPNATPDSAGLELASARSVEIVLAPRDGDEAAIWQGAALKQSGNDKIKVKVAIVSAEKPQTKQMELVRAAMARNPRVLVVEPIDPADVALAQAVAETRAQGIPVILLGSALSANSSVPPSPSGRATAPLVVVAPPPFASSAGELVAAAIRNAKAAELDPNGGALIVSSTVGDRFVPERLDALRAALKTAGITPVDEIQVTNDYNAGEKLVRESLSAHPKIVLLFSVDYTSTAAIRGLLNVKNDSPFVVAACYTSDTNIQDVSRQAPVAAAVDFTPVRLLRKSIATAASLSQGKVIPSPAELSMIVDDMPLHAVALRAAIANARKLKDQAKDEAKDGK
jgi:ABC-type sugar transport system substrate-binding protein